MQLRERTSSLETSFIDYRYYDRPATILHKLHNHTIGIIYRTVEYSQMTQGKIEILIANLTTPNRPKFYENDISFKGTANITQMKKNTKRNTIVHAIRMKIVAIFSKKECI